MNLNLNATQHCSMCAVTRRPNLERNAERVYPGGAGGFALCPHHDLMGASMFWPDAIRRALDMGPPPFRDGPG